MSDTLEFLNYVAIPLLGLTLFTEDIIATIGFASLYEDSTKLISSLCRKFTDTGEARKYQQKLVTSFRSFKCKMGLFYFDKQSKLSEIDLILNQVINLLVSF